MAPKSKTGETFVSPICIESCLGPRLRGDTLFSRLTRAQEGLVRQENNLINAC